MLEIKYRKQHGVALIVALMITVIIGVIALALADVSVKGQRKENAFFSNEVSYNNSVSALNTALTFLSKTSGTQIYNFVSTNPSQQSGRPAVLTLDGKTINIASINEIYQGMDAQLSDENYLNFEQSDSDFDNTKVWYRTAAGWGSNCANCVHISDANGNVVSSYRIEARDFSPFSSDVSGTTSNIGYKFYRVTVRGIDPISNAQTIIQSNIGILDTE